MNRVGLGLAVGAGYLLGRTKKLKLALAVGTAVAGKRMHLSPKALAELASQQLKANPQFKEIGDQLRQDLRGVGKAASGAMVERQIDALADRLHGRTAQVREQLSGVVPGASGRGARDEEPGAEEEEPEPEDEQREAEEPEDSGPRDEEEDSGPRDEEGGRRAPSRTPAKKTAKRAAKKAPAKKTAAKKTAARKTTAGKTAAKPAGKKAAEGTGGARARLPKGGGER
ncbi:DNA primase [Streptomyces sp. NPDC052701]|uniref:DNA primase n=1 Tax=Streptomyces sp. NPDC052701 TaxID=3155533 RepID=UPI00343F574D